MHMLNQGIVDSNKVKKNSVVQVADGFGGGGS